MQDNFNIIRYISNIPGWLTNLDENSLEPRWRSRSHLSRYGQSMWLLLCNKYTSLKLLLIISCCIK